MRELLSLWKRQLVCFFKEFRLKAYFNREVGCKYPRHKTLKITPDVTANRLGAEIFLVWYAE